MNPPAPAATLACGMYAFTPALRDAWRALFSRLPEFLPGCGGRIEVTFQTDDDARLAPGLLLAHVCGYPYLQHWAGAHRPVCAPAFAADGCRGVQYSSWFITPASGGVTGLEAARGKSVAVNDMRSNSGMNVLRYAIAGLMASSGSSGGKGFFGEVLLSGSHVASIELVAGGRVSLAAVDAITYSLLAQHRPALTRRVRIIGQSAHTTCPSFVAPAGAATGPAAITDALNRCLDALPETQRAALCLTGFQRVSESDYAAITELEKFAVERGYVELA